MSSLLHGPQHGKAALPSTGVQMFSLVFMYRNKLFKGTWFCAFEIINFILMLVYRTKLVHKCMYSFVLSKYLLNFYHVLGTVLCNGVTKSKPK